MGLRNGLAESRQKNQQIKHQQFLTPEFAFNFLKLHFHTGEMFGSHHGFEVIQEFIAGKAFFVEQGADGYGFVGGGVL